MTSIFLNLNLNYLYKNWNVLYSWGYLLVKLYLNKYLIVNKSCKNNLKKKNVDGGS